MDKNQASILNRLISGVVEKWGDDSLDPEMVVGPVVDFINRSVADYKLKLVDSSEGVELRFALAYGFLLLINQIRDQGENDLPESSQRRFREIVAENRRLGAKNIELMESYVRTNTEVGKLSSDLVVAIDVLKEIATGHDRNGMKIDYPDELAKEALRDVGLWFDEEDEEI